MILLRKLVSSLILMISAMMLFQGLVLADDKKTSGKKNRQLMFTIKAGENKELAKQLGQRSIIGLGTKEEADQANAYGWVLVELVRRYPQCFAGTDVSVVNTLTDNIIKYDKGEGATLHKTLVDTLRSHWFEPDSYTETLYRQFGTTSEPAKPCDAISLSHFMAWSMRQSTYGSLFFQRILAPLYENSPSITGRQKRVAVSGLDAETLWLGITEYYHPEEFVQIIRASSYLKGNPYYDRFINQKKDKSIVPEFLGKSEFYENFRMVNTFVWIDPLSARNQAGIGLERFYSEEQRQMFHHSLESIEPDGDLIFIASADPLAYQRFMAFMEPYIERREYVLVAEGGADEAMDDDRCLRSQFFKEIVDPDHPALCDFRQVVRFKKQGFIQMNLPNTLAE